MTSSPFNAQGQEINRRAGEAQVFTDDLGKNVQLEMVSIPGGSFQMGSADGEGDDDERPQHPVSVKPFQMGRYAITQAQWKAVTALPKVNQDLDPDPATFKGANRPMESVSWEQAVEFCDRLSRKTKHNYRLPSEAEWEYACRAGSSTTFHFGETITTDLVNHVQDRKQTTDVGNFMPNAFGLYDMHGNVWEWCFDHWHENYQGAPSDGSAWIEGGKSDRRLLRGGSWYNYPRHCRSAYRNGYGPGYRNNGLGFRVVCDTFREV